jgi:hypothetical protein
MKQTDSKTALANKTNCQYVAGQGFIDHGGPPPLPDGAVGDAATCSPPGDATDGSVHVLATPGAASEMRMVWHAAEGAWGPEIFGKGNRLAWTPAHLAAAGWRYLRSADAPARKQRRAPLVRRGDSR